MQPILQSSATELVVSYAQDRLTTHLASIVIDIERVRICVRTYMSTTIPDVRIHIHIARMTQRSWCRAAASGGRDTDRHRASVCWDRGMSIGIALASPRWCAMVKDNGRIYTVALHHDIPYHIMATLSIWYPYVSIWPLYDTVSRWRGHGGVRWCGAYRGVDGAGLVELVEPAPHL
jgi:hypothetical protein